MVKNPETGAYQFKEEVVSQRPYQRFFKAEVNHLLNIEY